LLLAMFKTRRPLNSRKAGVRCLAKISKLSVKGATDHETH
jgi:hypothetical protein